MSRIRLILLTILAVSAVGAVASASSASAFEFRWWGCKEVAGEGEEPPTKYDEHKCNTQKKALPERKWQWSKEATGETWKVFSKGGEFTLTVAGKSVTCKKVTDEGATEAAGADIATEIKFTECTTSAAGCKVKTAGQPNGTIVVTNAPTQLVGRVPGGGGAEVLADEFKQNATTKEFVTLKFEPKASCEAGKIPEETKVKGQVAAECINLASGEVELNFPNPALKGNTLEAFGLPATLTGKVTEFWNDEWGLQCR